jgi:hypothetical protein
MNTGPTCGNARRACARADSTHRPARHCRSNGYNSSAVGLSRGRARALKLAAFALLALIALPYACLPIYRFPPPSPFSGPELFNPYARLTGSWQRANLHAHGRAWIGLTSGRHSNEEVVRRYKELGYSVAGVSNYHEIAAHDGVATLPLYEHGYNIGKHHQLAVGARRVEWLDLPLWQSRSHLQFLIDRVAATADLVALVHPVSRNSYSPDDLSSLTGYHLIEIVNGKFPHDEAWDAALSAGRAVWAVANDDNHDLSDKDRLAVAWTMIDAPTSATSDIVDALRTGRSYAVLRTGEGSTDADIALSGVTLHAGTLNVSISGAPSTISFVGRNGAVRKSVDVTLSAGYTVQPTDTYVRAIVRAPRSTLYLNPVVRYDGRVVANPAASVDQGRTWLLRGFVIAGFAAFVFLVGRRRQRSRAFARAVVLAVMTFSAAPASAQSFPILLYTEEQLSDLPVSDNAFALLETVEPTLISDRFSNGGLYSGEPARIGGFLGSWTQTVYRINNIDVTDPTGTGAPLLFPDVLLWRHVMVQTGRMQSDVNAPGLSVTFEPQWPGATWTGSIQGAVSPFGSKRNSAPAPIADLQTWDRIAAAASGPLAAKRVGIAAGGSWTRGSQFDRGDARASDRTATSAFTHLVFRPADQQTIQAFGWLQRATYPFAYRVPFGQPDTSSTQTAAHIQASWNRPLPWLVYGGYTRRETAHEYDPATGANFERLRDGSPMELAWIAPGTVERWTVGALRGATTAPFLGNRHMVRGAIEGGGTRALSMRVPDATVHEYVDGQPARLWRFGRPQADSVRTARTFAAHVDDHFTIGSRVELDAGLRFDFVSGHAENASGRIWWQTWLPRADVFWTVNHRWQGVIAARFRRSAYQLPLDFLAVGDPAAPTADVHRWSGPSPAAGIVGAPVMRAGPGTGGSAAFSSIDADLARPVADEIAVGFELQPDLRFRFSWTGILRRERNLVGLVNVGAPASAYSAMTIADPGADVLNPEDDRLVTAYNRRPETFGLDRYVLTNPSTEPATFKGFEITARFVGGRFLFLAGATAGMAEGLAANRGFGPLENDQSRLGELYVNPNAATFARGRLFNDRAYTVKLASVLKFREDLKLGLIARYQDGQPFSRFLIVPNLNQGIEAVRAFPNGDSRFTYTATLDVRLQKIFTFRRHHLAAFIDAYNLTNLANEVEEVTTSAPGVRIASALQPPLAIHVGMRATF